MGDGNESRGSMWTWIAVGCGGFILLGIVGSCVGPGLVAMMFMDGLGGMGGFTPPPGSGPVVPGTAGLELPPPPGPLMPVGAATATATGRKRFALSVTAVEEIDDIAVGDVCPFEVEQLPRGGGSYWCRTELRCGERLLYGGPGQGYFDCTFPESEYDHLQAYDYGMQTDDGDPSFTIDFDGAVNIRDVVDGKTVVVSGRLVDPPPPDPVSPTVPPVTPAEAP